MSVGELQVIDTNTQAVAYGEELREFVTMRVDGQLLGISVLMVRDVLKKLKVAHVPLSPDVVEGALNLRGRVVTVYNMRIRLGLPTHEQKEPIHIVIDQEGELYSLMVDSIGDVLNLPMNRFEKTPSNMSSTWRDVALGVFQLEKELLVVLDTQAVLKI